MRHMGVGEIPYSPEELIEFLQRVATTANTINPHISTPYAMETATEIELTGGETETQNSQDGDSLSFDIDTDDDP